MTIYPSWNTDFSLPKRALLVSTQSLPAFVAETEALLDEIRKAKRPRFSGNSHQRRVKRRKWAAR